jgi:hypothetical protein
VADDDDKDAEILVFRGERPVAVPEMVVLEAQREYRAWQHHQGGKSWEQVAAIEGYPTAAAARQDVRRYLTEGRALVTEWSRAEMLAVKMAQLDTLLASCWDAAIGGKLPAIALAADLVTKQIKVLRLDEAGAEDETRARTVVVLGDEESYTKALEQASGD